MNKQKEEEEISIDPAAIAKKALTNFGNGTQKKKPKSPQEKFKHILKAPVQN